MKDFNGYRKRQSELVATVEDELLRVYVHAASLSRIVENLRLSLSGARSKSECGLRLFVLLGLDCESRGNVSGDCNPDNHSVSTVVTVRRPCHMHPCRPPPNRGESMLHIDRSVCLGETYSCHRRPIVKSVMATGRVGHGNALHVETGYQRL